MPSGCQQCVKPGFLATRPTEDCGQEEEEKGRKANYSRFSGKQGSKGFCLKVRNRSLEGVGNTEPRTDTKSEPPPPTYGVCCLSD